MDEGDRASAVEVACGDSVTDDHIPGLSEDGLVLEDTGMIFRTVLWTALDCVDVVVDEEVENPVTSTCCNVHDANHRAHATKIRCRVYTLIVHC